MIKELVRLGHMKEWNDSFILTRKGQLNYGSGTDPYLWVKTAQNRNMSFSELCGVCKELFGVEPEIMHDEKD